MVQESANKLTAQFQKILSIAAKVVEAAAASILLRIVTSTTPNDHKK